MRRHPKPVASFCIPAGNIGGILVIIDSKGDAYMKQLDFSLSPIQTQYVRWTYLGNPWNERLSDETT